MELITCQRAHYYRRGTGLTRIRRKATQWRHFSFNEPLCQCWGDIRGPLSCPLFPLLVRLVSWAVPLVLTSRLFFLVLSLSPNPRIRSPPNTVSDMSSKRHVFAIFAVTYDFGLYTSEWFVKYSTYVHWQCLFSHSIKCCVVELRSSHREGRRAGFQHLKTGFIGIAI